MSTPVRAVSGASTLDPPPPDDIYYIYFEKAAVPAKTPGGLEWEGGAPDPFAKLIVNGAVMLRTPTQSKTRSPTWDKQRKENQRIEAGSEVFVEVWDDNPVVDHPICRAKVRDLPGMREGDDTEILCDSGARVWLHVEPARAILTSGLSYEVRGADGVRVTRVAKGSAADRAGLTPGDRILGIQGNKVSEMDALKVRSLMNQYSRPGLKLDVWFQNGKRHAIELKEGAVYPLAGDDLKLQKDSAQK